MSLFKRGGQVPIGLYYLKRRFNDLMRLLGYKLVGQKKIVKHNDFDSILKFLVNKLSKNEENIIFDIGANIGQSIDRFQNIFPRNKIYSFEPTPNLFENLVKKYSNDKNVIINKYAISNENNTNDFFTYKYHRINSLYSTDKKTKFHKSRKIASEEKNDDFFQKIIKVETKKLDTIAEEYKLDSIDIIKIDTQGNEDKILEGCHNLLSSKKVKIIELELILGFAYKKQLSFFDIEKTLNNYNYKLIAIKESGNVLSHSNFQTDLIYVNSDVFEEIKKLHENNEIIKDVMSRTDGDNPLSY